MQNKRTQQQKREQQKHTYTTALKTTIPKTKNAKEQKQADKDTQPKDRNKLDLATGPRDVDDSYTPASPAQNVWKKYNVILTDFSWKHTRRWQRNFPPWVLDFFWKFPEKNPGHFPEIS